VQYWHASTGKCIFKINSENGQSLQCMDLSVDNRFLAVSGTDYKVYIYDEATRELI